MPFLTTPTSADYYQVAPLTLPSPHWGEGFQGWALSTRGRGVARWRLSLEAPFDTLRANVIVKPFKCH